MKDRIIGNTQFRIIKKIAEGGMGAVYKALQTGESGFEKVVAIKTLLGELVKNKRSVERFIGEAKLVANLIHENIVQIYQLDKYKNEHYFVLEFVDGISLYDFIEFHNKVHEVVPEKLAVFIAARIARGLAYAHSRHNANGDPLNIVHCDICPHNVMINTEGVPKITDFGIAKSTSFDDDDTVSGKLPFMSPEQANGLDVDFGSDLYSLGMVLFYVLCGKTARVVEDKSIKEILEQAKENHIDWQRLPDIDKDLLAILQRLLNTSPEERYKDTSELARDLEYHIYKDGYGPTIVTLAAYMKKQIPALFADSELPDTGEKTSIGSRTLQLDKVEEIADKTIKLDEDFFKDIDEK